MNINKKRKKQNINLKNFDKRGEHKNKQRQDDREREKSRT